MEISYSAPPTCVNGYQPSICASQLVPPICSPNYIPVTTVTEDLRNNTYQAPQRTSHIDPNTQYFNHYQYQPFNYGTRQKWSAEYQNYLYTRYAQTQNFVTPSSSWHESSNTGYETRISSPCHPRCNKPNNYNPRIKGVIHKPKARGKETQNQSSAPPSDTNNHSTGMALPIAPPTKANPTDKAPPPVLFKDNDNTDIIQDSDIQNTDKQNTDDTTVCKIVNTFSCAETDKSPPTGEETVTKTHPDKIACANSC